MCDERAGVPDPHDAQGLGPWIKLVLLRQPEDGRENILRHRPGITASGRREANPLLGEPRLIDVIGPRGRRADETHLGACQQGGVHPCHASHDQGGRIGQFGGPQRAAVEGVDLAEPRKEPGGGGNRLVDQNPHDGMIIAAGPERCRRRSVTNGESWQNGRDERIDVPPVDRLVAIDVRAAGGKPAKEIIEELRQIGHIHETTAIHVPRQ